MDPERNFASWVEVDSSAVSAFVWFEDGRGRGHLDVRWRQSGRVYRYSGVTEDVYRRLLDAPSRGRFVNQVIKPRYPATPL